MVNLLCYTQSLICIMSCHGHSKISYSPNELSLGNMFFRIEFVQENNLAPMKNSPGMQGMLNKSLNYL